jgi:FixJ family two-component response regulator
MIERHAGSVIVVDDDPNVLKFTSLLLEKGVFRVCLWQRPEALDVLQKNNIDAVLTDIMMPEMSGIELLERIHSTDPDIPVILITGFADLDKAIEAIKKGAFDFITKPYDSTYLTHSIEKAVRYHRLVKMEAGYRQILEELNAEVETLITERTMGSWRYGGGQSQEPCHNNCMDMQKDTREGGRPERMKEGLNIILSEAERLEAIVKDFQELFKARERASNTGR